LAIENLKRHKSPGVDQTPAELIKAEGRTIHYEIHKLIISIWNKEWKESIIVPIYKEGDKTDCSTHSDISLWQLLQNFIQHPAVKVNSICRRNYWRSSMWISMQQVNYRIHILHLSNKGKGKVIPLWPRGWVVV